MVRHGRKRLGRLVAQQRTMVADVHAARQRRGTGSESYDDVAGEGGADHRVEHHPARGGQDGRLLSASVRNTARSGLPVGVLAPLPPELPHRLARLLGDPSTSTGRPPVRFATNAPTVDLPDPMMPTSTSCLIARSRRPDPRDLAPGPPPSGRPRPRADGVRRRGRPGSRRSAAGRRRDGRGCSRGTRVVVEADGVGKAGRLDYRPVEAPHAIGTVEEPPRRTKPQCGVVPGQGASSRL